LVSGPWQGRSSISQLLQLAEEDSVVCGQDPSGYDITCSTGWTCCGTKCLHPGSICCDADAGVMCDGGSKCCGKSCMTAGSICCNPDSMLTCSAGSSCCGKNSSQALCCAAGSACKKHALSFSCAATGESQPTCGPDALGYMKTCSYGSSCCGDNCMAPGATCCRADTGMMCTAGSQCCGANSSRALCCAPGWQCKEHWLSFSCALPTA